MAHCFRPRPRKQTTAASSAVSPRPRKPRSDGARAGPGSSRTDSFLSVRTWSAAAEAVTKLPRTACVRADSRGGAGFPHTRKAGIAHVGVDVHPSLAPREKPTSRKRRCVEEREVGREEI